MRGKVAKYLRRQVERKTVGKPQIEYAMRVGSRKLYRNGETVTHGVIHLIPGCGRAVYQQVKRKYHAERRAV